MTEPDTSLGLTTLRRQLPSRTRGQLLRMLDDPICVDCSGRGFTVDADLIEEVECPACDGTGKGSVER